MGAAVVTASTHDFSLVGYAFAMGAAIFLFLGCNAIASSVSAFPGAGHVCLLGSTDSGRRPGIDDYDAG